MKTRWFLRKRMSCVFVSNRGFKLSWRPCSQWNATNGRRQLQHEYLHRLDSKLNSWYSAVVNCCSSSANRRTRPYFPLSSIESRTKLLASATCRDSGHHQANLTRYLWSSVFSEVRVYSMECTKDFIWFHFSFGGRARQRGNLFNLPLNVKGARRAKDAFSP